MRNLQFIEGLMKIGQLNVEDIDFIIKHISLSSVYEIHTFGKTINEVKDKFINSIGKEFSGIFYSSEIKPEAMIMLKPTGNLKWEVDLITVVGAWERIGLSLTRFLIQFGNDLIKRSGGLIEAYSPFNYGKYFNWFSAMGFQLDNTNRNGVFRYFKQVR
jgi:hypothetical protein